MQKLFIFLSLLSSLAACKCNGNEVKVDFTVTPIENQINTFLFKATVSGEYSFITWKFPEENISSVKETTYYFPQKGEYQVTFTATTSKGDVSITKKVTVNEDDNTVDTNLVWSEEFNGNTLRSDYWTVETDIHVNNELQKYTSSGNYTIANGLLTITAQKVDDKKQYGSYTSARLITEGKKEFKYGRMEIRAKLPKGKGTWPAIWMLGSNINKGTGWPACGEIDIMEYVGYRPNVVQASLHCSDRNGGNSITATAPIEKEEDFHVYGLKWTSTKIECYVDDPQKPYFTYPAPNVKTQANWPFDQPYFFILNVAVGGDWGGQQGIDNAIFPVTMVVDYVRVYKE